MKKHLQYFAGFAAALTVAAGCLAFAAKDDAVSGTKAFVGARIIDGTGKAPVENATIIVRNGRVEAVGSSVKVPSGAQRIDASGKTIIPGLASGHSHVTKLSELDR